jgi:hypothetical protein
MRALKRTDGDSRTIAEYTFDENEINRASVNIDNAVHTGSPLLLIESADHLIPGEQVEGSIKTEVMLFFE